MFTRMQISDLPVVHGRVINVNEPWQKVSCAFLRSLSVPEYCAIHSNGGMVVRSDTMVRSVMKVEGAASSPLTPPFTLMIRFMYRINPQKARTPSLTEFVVSLAAARQASSRDDLRHRPAADI